jgi:hypothetical protein
MGIYFFKMFDNFYGMLDIFSASVVLQYDDPTNHEIYDGFASGFVNYKKGALDSQPQVIKFTSCLPLRWISWSCEMLKYKYI